MSPEALVHKEVVLNNRHTFVIAMGYSGYDEEQGARPDDCEDAPTAKAMGRIFREAFKAKDTRILLSTNCTKPKIIDAIQGFSKTASRQDTLVVTYHGHGKPNWLNIPSALNPHSDQTDELSKEELFQEIGKFPGRKIVILSTCHGDYWPIPDNTLLITPSKRDTVAFTTNFIGQMIHDLVSIEGLNDPLSSFVSLILSTYHNRPFGPIQNINRDWDYFQDIETFETEKQLGKEILNGYQRANVRCTLLEDMVPLEVNHLCNFI